jgi:hypothetical protein
MDRGRERPIQRSGAHAVAIRADIGNVADIEHLFAASLNEFARLDFTLQQATKYVADNGRIIYVWSSSTAYPLPGYGLYGGSKIAAQFLVEVLAKEVGPRRGQFDSADRDRGRRSIHKRSSPARFGSSSSRSGQCSAWERWRTSRTRLSTWRVISQHS